MRGGGGGGMGSKKMELGENCLNIFICESNVVLRTFSYNN